MFLITEHPLVFVNSTFLIYSFFLPTQILSREQLAELTRLGQTLMHIERLFWIVADDSEVCNSRLDKLFDNFGE
jgi:beta-1,3-glucuronyltransferase S